MRSLLRPLHRSSRLLLTALLVLSFLLPGAVPMATAQTRDSATIHYHRPDGVYDGWGLHTWLDAADPTDWALPLAPIGTDDFGIYWEVPLVADAAELGFIVHQGDTKDPGPDMILDLTTATEAWIISGDLKLYTAQPDPSARPNGDLAKQRAHWVTADTIAYPLPTTMTATVASEVPTGTVFSLYDASAGGMQVTVDGIAGAGVASTPLTLDPAGLPAAVLEKFPHLDGYVALTLAAGEAVRVPNLLKGQLAVQVLAADGSLLDATGVQIPGVLDELFAYDGPLGLTWQNGTPTLRLWAPTAKRVRLLLYDDPTATAPSDEMAMAYADGVWSATGAPEWKGLYYRYEVRVFVPSTGAVEVNEVTDPYAFSLSTNSSLSQIVDLTDPELMPEGWAELEKPPLDAPEDITVYELHMRDFSAYDPTVPEEHRGTYLAFTHADSNGMQHLQRLADAGLTHLHLLPTFDIATINENRAAWLSPDAIDLADLPPDSEEQQAAVTLHKDEDGFNWGYDPYHYIVPEGSYATDPEGGQRVLEYRQMVMALNEMGLRVVNDVVFNHTNASGQAERSVLDRIVPGYYHRLNADGVVETSTCCQNTATEHEMMEKLMLDAVYVWATQYKIDAFRFDLMGHHMRRNMLAVREMLDGLTLTRNGVDGSKIYIYGEGWDFGEVAGNARGVNATQSNMAGTGIGTFNDRLRDGVRGVGPFDTGENLKRQGWISGLYWWPNAYEWGGDAVAYERLGVLADWIHVGMMGNLKDFMLVDHRGYAMRGDEIDYNGAPTGYTLDPQENIVYADKHDNQTLFDIVQLVAPPNATIEQRAQMIELGHAVVLLSQGVPFQQAGTDMLRSKSFDRDSYNSGDWFNFLDFTYQDNGFGRGLPPAEKNEADWPVMQPLLANPDLQASPELIEATHENFLKLLEIRYSTPLFRLRSADEIKRKLRFHLWEPAIPLTDTLPLTETGALDAEVAQGTEPPPPPEEPVTTLTGVIMMSIADLDAERTGSSVAQGTEPQPTDWPLVVVIINANLEPVTVTETLFSEIDLRLHPALVEPQQGAAAAAGEAGATTASFDFEEGQFVVPGLDYAVWYAGELPPEMQDLFDTYDAQLRALRAQQPSTDELAAQAQATAQAQAQVAAQATAAAAAPASVSFPGTIAATLGGNDWDPADPFVQATDVDGNGVWTLTVTLPPGTFEFKAAVNGSWDENYGLGGVPGGDNIPLALDAESEVTFVYERAGGAVYALVDGEVVAGQ